MANNRLSMCKILEVLRLFFELGRSRREIARVIGASPTTVSDYLARTKVASLSYPLPPEIDEQGLDRLLCPPRRRPGPRLRRGERRYGAQPDTF